VAALDQLREVAEEERQQQHLDVRAVDVGVREDADLAVAQARESRVVVGAVRVDADRDRDVVDLVVREQAVALDLPGVEHLAAQRQDRLRLLVAAHLGAAAGRIALDQEDLVERRSRLSQSVSLPGSTATPEPFFFSTFCAARWRVCAWRITSSASFLPYSTCWLSQSSSAGLTQLDTRRSASRLFRRSLIWPWNCGSSTLAESTKLARENTSSGIGLTPLGSRPCMSMKPLIAPNRPSFRPDSWVPPATVGIRLT
jgi:hypothetical protein